MLAVERLLGRGRWPASISRCAADLRPRGARGAEHASQVRGYRTDLRSRMSSGPCSTRPRRSPARRPRARARRAAPRPQTRRLPRERLPSTRRSAGASRDELAVAEARSVTGEQSETVARRRAGPLRRPARGAARRRARRALRRSGAQDGIAPVADPRDHVHRSRRRRAARARTRALTQLSAPARPRARARSRTSRRPRLCARGGGRIR